MNCSHLLTYLPPPRATARALVVGVGFLLLAACSTTPPATPATPAAVATMAAAVAATGAMAPPAAMRVEGVPPLSPASMADIQRYSAVVGHGFVDWHPTKREMLVAHRPFGVSPTQIYRVAGSLVAPEKLTDGAEPVNNAQHEPRQGRYIVFARSSGGDEAFQPFRLDPETGVATTFTAADQRHALVGWIESRSLAIVASVPLDRTAAGGTRAAINTTLSIVDPPNPERRRVLAELPRGG